jgi:hypothetical protein
MSDEQDSWLHKTLGLDVSKYIGLPKADDTRHEEPGILDIPLHAIGKAVGMDDLGNPNRTFVEDVAANSIDHFKVKDGDGMGMQTAKALGIAVTMPLWGAPMVGAAALDHANQIINDFGHMPDPNQMSPTGQPSPAPAEETPPASAGGDASSTPEGDKTSDP